MEEVVRIVVTGHVQGVGFRYFTERLAFELGVAGWCRNLRGGEVEVLARVTPSQKARLLAGLREGPRGARVTALQVERAADPGQCPSRGFRVVT